MNGSQNGVIGLNGSATMNGLLAPQTAAQRAQHSRAVSLPVFAVPAAPIQVPIQGLGNGVSFGNSHSGRGFTAMGGSGMNGWAEN